MLSLFSRCTRPTSEAWQGQASPDHEPHRTLGSLSPSQCLSVVPLFPSTSNSWQEHPKWGLKGNNAARKSHFGHAPSQSGHLEYIKHHRLDPVSAGKPWPLLFPSTPNLVSFQPHALPKSERYRSPSWMPPSPTSPPRRRCWPTTHPLQRLRPSWMACAGCWTGIRSGAAACTACRLMLSHVDMGGWH
ncbi:hypothetical protein MPH_09090 [Macrophomina phaseolina MS6]|uniref:Uncharacterized protein n=1 Tax=Macrophomina phaseolina (strain MS6) TaxID=1126212 RepID=K2QVM5_MACPH|nr:hypothetical protein MPH_09090 [Macrophomina phaseolina MS6]